AGAGAPALGEAPVVAACRRALHHGQEPGEAADEDPGRTPGDGQRVRVAVLRHEHAGAGVGTGEVDEVELLAVPDLEVLGELALVGDQADRGGQQVDQPVDLPHGVACVLDHPGEAEQAGDARPVVDQAAAVDAAGPGSAAVHTVQPAQHHPR